MKRQGKTSEDIPGYHYDAERRRYFRIPPSHFSQLPLYESIPTNLPSIAPSPASLPIRPSLSLHHLLETRQRVLNQDDFTRSFHKCLPGSLRKTSVIEPPLSELTNGLHDCIDMMVDQSGKLLAVKCVDNSSIDGHYSAVSNIVDGRLHSVHLNTKRMMTQGFDILLEEDECGTHLFLELYCGSRVAKMRYNSIAFGDHQTLCLNRLSKTRLAHRNRYCICVAKINPCRYSRDKCTYGLGGSDGSVLLCIGNKIVSCPKSIHARNKVAVVSLAFAKESELLFSGYRNGVITVWDLRGKPQSYWTASEPKNGRVFSSIEHIHPLRDTNYFISSAFGSKLSLWDIRMSKKVLHYKGHVSTYKRGKSIVDKTETFLTAVGSDCCIRVWSVGTGQLIRSIRPEDYGSVDESNPPLPTICYSDSFGGRQGKPTLTIFNTSSQPRNLVLYTL